MILLISTTGVSLSKHYSGGILYSVSVIGDAESCCEIPCDCCNDETDFFVLNVDYIISIFDYPQIQSIDLIGDSNFLLNTLDNFGIFSGNNFKFYPDISPPKQINHLSFFQSFRC